MQVAIGHARKAACLGAFVAGETTMRQCVPVGMANRFPGCCAACEIALARRIAPSTLRVPVPGFDRELGVLAISYCLPSRRENRFERGLGQVFLNCRRWHSINPGT